MSDPMRESSLPFPSNTEDVGDAEEDEDEGQLKMRMVEELANTIDQLQRQHKEEMRRAYEGMDSLRSQMMTVIDQKFDSQLDMVTPLKIELDSLRGKLTEPRRVTELEAPTEEYLSHLETFK